MSYTMQINIMQNNLVHIRKSFGMSAEDFGKLIGVTKQTINNIEHGRQRLTQPMYFAILYVMEKMLLPNCIEHERDIIERLLAEKVVEFNYSKSLSFAEKG